MIIKMTIRLFNKVLVETYDTDKVTIEDRDTDTFVMDKENGNVLAIYPKVNTTQEEV